MTSQVICPEIFSYCRLCRDKIPNSNLQYLCIHHAEKHPEEREIQFD